jgi:DNA-binding Lrp family transcriptional regulator
MEEPAASGEPDLDALDRRLLDEFQHDFPLSPRPHAEIAKRVGTTERDVIDRFTALERRGLLSRIGPVFGARKLGASTLCAMAVPPTCIEAVARLVSRYPEVNHNYEREHELNLWFVLTAADEDRIGEILAQVREQTGLEVLDLPLLAPYHIDLGFPLW